MKIIHPVGLVSFLIIGCGIPTSTSPEQQCLRCSIDSLAIEHFQEHREGCRFTQIKLFVSINNSCEYPCSAIISVHTNPCERPVMNSSFYIMSDSAKHFYASNEKDSVITISRNENFTTTLRSGFRLKGWSLESIVELNDEYINKSELVYTLDGKEFRCTKSKEFSISYYLDDMRISGPDNPLFYKVPPDPVIVNFDSIMSLE